MKHRKLQVVGLGVSPVEVLIKKLKSTLKIAPCRYPEDGYGWIKRVTCIIIHPKGWHPWACSEGWHLVWYDFYFIWNDFLFTRFYLTAVSVCKCLDIKLFRWRSSLRWQGWTWRGTFPRKGEIRCFTSLLVLSPVRCQSQCLCLLSSAQKSHVLSHMTH